MMHNVLNRRWQVLQVPGQKDRIHQQIGQLREREPLKNQPDSLLVALKWLGVLVDAAVWRQFDQKIKGQLVGSPALVDEKVLDDPQQTLNLRFNLQLFTDLADQRGAGVLTKLNPPAGQRPE